MGKNHDRLTDFERQQLIQLRSIRDAIEEWKAMQVQDNHTFYVSHLNQLKATNDMVGLLSQAVNALRDIQDVNAALLAETKKHTAMIDWKGEHTPLPQDEWNPDAADKEPWDWGDPNMKSPGKHQDPANKTVLVDYCEHVWDEQASPDPEVPNWWVCRHCRVIVMKDPWGSPEGADDPCAYCGHRAGNHNGGVNGSCDIEGCERGCDAYIPHDNPVQREAVERMESQLVTTPASWQEPEVEWKPDLNVHTCESHGHVWMPDPAQVEYDKCVRCGIVTEHKMRQAR